MPRLYAGAGLKPPSRSHLPATGVASISLTARLRSQDATGLDMETKSFINTEMSIISLAWW
ncbi:hypothetical protein D9M71_795690 [compost metagenome]